MLKPSVVPGDCQLVRAATKSQSVGGRVCGSKGLALTRLTALHDSSEPPGVRLRAPGDFRQQRRYLHARGGGPYRSAASTRTVRPYRRSPAGHTPTKTESVRNPVPRMALG